MTKVAVVLGAQWGDEGKGKIIDLLASKYDYVCRCQGGSNAGHTVVVDNRKYFFHLLPSCLVNPSCKAVIGNGVVIHLETLFGEIDHLDNNGVELNKRLLISDRAHIVFGFHQEIDGIIEEMKGKNKIGTTKRGIGPTYSSKILRNGIRMGDLVYDFAGFEKKFIELVDFNKKMFNTLDVDIHGELEKYKAYAVLLEPFVCDTANFVNDLIQEGKKVLIEGANGCLLDVDFGSYPYVTSSNCGVSGVCSGIGIPPKLFGSVNAVVKAYTTRVGNGPFPTEDTGEYGEILRSVGKEFGTTTGRPRRCGWLDLVIVKYCIMLNGVTSISLTKLDTLGGFSEIKVGTAYLDQNGVQTRGYPSNLCQLEKCSVVYETLPGWKSDISEVKCFEDLPVNCQNYVKFIENHLGVPVTYIGVGQARDAIIERNLDKF